MRYYFIMKYYLTSQLIRYSISTTLLRTTVLFLKVPPRIFPRILLRLWRTHQGHGSNIRDREGDRRAFDNASWSHQLPLIRTSSRPQFTIPLIPPKSSRLTKSSIFCFNCIPYRATHHTAKMVELRKRKAPPDPAPSRPPMKKANSVKSTTSSKKGDSSANGSAATGRKVAVGDTITIDGFGGEVENNDGEKVTLKKLVDESKSGVVLFTYPKASTPGCRHSTVFNSSSSVVFKYSTYM